VSKFTPSSAILELGDGFYDAVKPAEFNGVGVRYFDEVLSNSLVMGAGFYLRNARRRESY